MARRFRRRKPRVVWLPVQGDLTSTVPESTDYLNGIGGTLTLFNTGATATDFVPVTFDYSDAASSETGVDFRSLQDLTSGNNYRLRRIVGKIFLGGAQEANGLSAAPLLDVACGFIINRTDSSGNALVSNAIGSANEIPFGPISQDSAEDPWIWRRRWMLGSIASAISVAQASANAAAAWQTANLSSQGLFPNTNAHYGSVHDGPHIDAKTARVIGAQERLFFWIQGRVVNPGAGTNNGTVNWYLDLRILASLRAAVGNRRNASR